MNAPVPFLLKLRVSSSDLCSRAQIRKQRGEPKVANSCQQSQKSIKVQGKGKSSRWSPQTPLILHSKLSALLLPLIDCQARRWPPHFPLSSYRRGSEIGL